MRRWLIAAAALVLALLAGAGPVAAAATPARAPSVARQGELAAVRVVPVLFTAADGAHDETRAGRAREIAAVIARATGDPAAARLVRALQASAVRLQPWPIPLHVRTLATAAETSLGLGGAVPKKPYAQIRTLLERGRGASGARAQLDLIEAYALYELGPGARLAIGDAALGDSTGEQLWHAVQASGEPAALRRAIDTAERSLHTDSVALGDVTASRASIVADAGVIVFREGLEAVLILAAITASFTGERRRLRRPVFAGAMLGLVASAVTYVLAQEIIAALGDGGLRLQAITGILAIAVLLVVTNWFFHKVYWSEWISRFNKRKRAIEKIDKLGFISGQTVAFVVLGLTSVYREGFETVLFLQNLQVSAGTGATLLGVGIGLGATFAVGAVTFLLERKLPYKKMLIATGVLIGLVLAVMTGTTVHSLQGLGWLPQHTTPFNFSLGLGRWLGLYPTWEGIALQLLAMLVVYGSYAVARAMQMRRRRRAMRAHAGDAVPAGEAAESVLSA